MSGVQLTFDDYCIKFELDPEDNTSRELYTTYTENVESDEKDSIFSSNSDEKVQGKNTIFG